MAAPANLLETISRRRFVRAAILSTASLIFAPELAYAQTHGPACANGGQPCTQCAILGVRSTLSVYQPRVINPWLNPKVV